MYRIQFGLLIYKMYNSCTPSVDDNDFYLKSGNYREEYDTDVKYRPMLKDIFGENCYEELIEEKNHIEGNYFYVMFIKDITEEELFYYELKYNINCIFDIVQLKNK